MVIELERYNPGEISQEPKIVIDESITASDCPYLVSVEPDGAAKLLKLAGVKDANIGQTEVVLTRQQSPEDIEEYGNTLGICFGDKIVLYTDNIIKSADLTLKTKKVLRRPLKKGVNYFPELTTGKRFSAYLSTAPRERATSTAQRLSRIHAGNLADRIFTHEAKHSSDAQYPKPIFLDSLRKRGQTIFPKLNKNPHLRPIRKIIEQFHYQFLDSAEKSARGYEQDMYYSGIKVVSFFAKR